MTNDSPVVRITFLGGLGEIGRNMAAVEIDGQVAVVDVGIFFPDPEHPGVDLILPDWTALAEGSAEVTTLFLTHGHEDHIGGVPYFLRDFPDVRIYGTRLTLALLEAKLEEWPEIGDVEMVEIDPGDVVRDGPFEVEAVQVTHSIPDGVGLAFRTPHGLIVHSGDFKLDQTPVDGRITDLSHLARLGDEGVALLLADSTNADRPGHVPTERVVGRALREHFRSTPGLIVVTSFASHIHRVQQALDIAREVGRRPVFVGRSMVRNVGIASELGYLEHDPSTAVEPTDVGRHDRSELVVICTGSQGEPYSAVSLMAAGEHRDIELREGDLVVLASSLIPGNEQAIFRSINGLTRRGAKVVHTGIADIHVSGHASREDLILYHNLLEPEFVVPVHGEHRHLHAHKDIAVETGCLPDRALVCEDGDVLELEGGLVRRAGTVQAGRVFIDGLLTDVGPAVLRDRRRLAGDGTCVCVVSVDPQRGELVGVPLVIQKGVVYDEEEDAFVEGALKAVTSELDRLAPSSFEDTATVQRHITQALGRYWSSETGRRPVYIPVVIEV